MDRKLFYIINNAHQDFLLQAYRGLFAILIVAGIACQAAIAHPLASFVAAFIFTQMFKNLEKAVSFRKKDVDYFQKMLLRFEHDQFKEKNNSTEADYHLFKSVQDSLGDYNKALAMRDEKIALDTFASKEVMAGHKSATRALIDKALMTCALCGVWAPFVNTLLTYKA